MRACFKIFFIALFFPLFTFADFTHIVRAKRFSQVKIECANGVPSITVLKYIPKHIRMISASENLICVWDIRTLERVKRHYNEAFGKINALDVDADGRFAYFCGGTAGEKGRLFKLNLHTGEHSVIAEASDEFYALSYNPNVNLLAVGSMNGEIIVIKPEDASVVFKSEAEASKIVSIEFNADGAKLAIAYANGRICVRDTADSFNTLSADFNARCVPISLKFFPGSNKDIMVLAGYGTDSCLVRFNSFTERTRRQISTPDFNASSFFARGVAFPFVLAGKEGDLCAYNSNPKDEPQYFESVNCRLECVERGSMANIIAAGESGRIFAWQNYNGILLGGIVLQDAKGENYAVWTVKGSAYSTLENSVSFMNENGEKIKKSPDILSKEKTEEFIRSKSEPKKKVETALAEKKES